MSYAKKDLGGIIAIFLMVIIGLALTPSVTELVLSSTTHSYNAISGAGPGNLSGAARAIYRLVPLFWVLLVVAVGLAGLAVWLKKS